MERRAFRPLALRIVHCVKSIGMNGTIAPVDRLAPSTLCGLTIGETRSRLQKRVADALDLSGALSNNLLSDEEVLVRLNRWFNETFSELRDMFTRKDHALAFLVAGQTPAQFSEARSRYRHQHEKCSRELVDAVRRFEAEREALASALEEVQDRVSRHDETMAALRSIGSDTEALWERLVKEPMLAGPITKLMNNGVATNAIYDLLKNGALALLG